jgi:hypothetical protein
MLATAVLAGTGVAGENGVMTGTGVSTGAVANMVPGGAVGAAEVGRSVNGGGSDPPVKGGEPALPVNGGGFGPSAGPPLQATAINIRAAKTMDRIRANRQDSQRLYWLCSVNSSRCRQVGSA